METSRAEVCDRVLLCDHRPLPLISHTENCSPTCQTIRKEGKQRASDTDQNTQKENTFANIVFDRKLGLDITVGCGNRRDKDPTLVTIYFTGTKRIQ